MPAIIRRTNPRFYVRCLPNGPRGTAPRIEDLSSRITALRYKDEERKADKLSLTVDNFNLELFDDPAFRKGMQLEVSWGYANNMAPSRICVVQRIVGATVLTIECLAESILLHRATRSRVFENVRRSDVVRTIAREAGFGDDVLDVEETPIVYPRIAQGGLTDAQLLVRLARREGFEFYVDHTGFHWHRRRVGSAPIRVLHYYTDPGAGDVVTFNVDNDITARPGRVRRRGRDPLEGADIDESADDASDEERPTLSPMRIIVDPETRRTRTEILTGAEEVAPTTAPDAATARREAVGRFRRIQQTAIKMKMTIVGDPSMLAKTVVETRGMRQRLSTRYYVKSVEHAISGGGYTTDLEMVSDGDGGHSTESRAARGLELLDVGTPTRGRPNTEPAAPGAETPGAAEEGEPLEPHVIIDPETRRTRTEYRDRRGGGASGGA
jgi:phage protein D